MRPLAEILPHARLIAGARRRPALMVASADGIDNGCHIRLVNGRLKWEAVTDSFIAVPRDCLPPQRGRSDIADRASIVQLTGKFHEGPRFAAADPNRNWPAISLRIARPRALTVSGVAVELGSSFEEFSVSNHGPATSLNTT